MEEQLIGFEVAKLAKEKGFRGRVEDCYDMNGSINDYDSRITYTHYLAPTQSLLQKWLRDEYSIDIYLGRTGVRDAWNLDGVRKFGYSFIDSEHRWKTEFKTYEEALEQGLLEALKLI